MSPQEEPASLSLSSSLFLGDLQFLHSRLKPCLIPSRPMNHSSTNETSVPSNSRYFAPFIDEPTASVELNGNFGKTEQASATRLSCRRSWEWESAAAKDREPRGGGNMDIADLDQLCCETPADRLGSSSSVSVGSIGQRTWVGPTLLDIESALATMPPITLSSMASLNAVNSTPTASISSSLREGVDEGTSSRRTPALTAVEAAPHRDSTLRSREETQTISLTSEETKEQRLAVSDDQDRKSRAVLRTKLQRRAISEPRYTIKVRSKVEMVEDGYRWRKYGQKLIKSNGRARSYYRCTDGRCAVKKQVEKSSEDEEIVEVSYEGIHMHHRPNPLNPSTVRAQLLLQQQHPAPSSSSLARTLF